MPERDQVDEDDLDADDKLEVTKFSYVRFCFFRNKEDTELIGTVLLRNGDMILDIPGGDGPYLIVGKLSGHVYGGPSEVRGRIKKVDAKWADVEGEHVGTWVEDGYKYLFSFVLSNQRG